MPGEILRRRSREAVSRPKVVQFSLTEAEFDEVSGAAARAGLARGAFAAEVTLAATRGMRDRAGRRSDAEWWLHQRVMASLIGQRWPTDLKLDLV